MWIPFALVFPAMIGVVNLIDKVIVDRYSPGVFVYAIWIGVFELMIGAICYGAIVSFQEPEVRTLVGGMLTGASSATALMLYLGALRLGQVSRVVSIWFLYPLMVAPMAALFLGESLSGLTVGAIVLAVMGAVLVSWQGGIDGRTFGNPVIILLALCAALSLAVSFVLNKEFIEDDSFWQFFASYRLGFAPAMLWPVVLPRVRRMVPGMARNRGFLGLYLVVQGIVTVVLMIRFVAVNLADVSLVTAVSSVQPGLVFLYSLVLAARFPASFGSWITQKTLRPQAAGIVAITAGVVIIGIQ